jgi:hypothetical protein
MEKFKHTNSTDLPIYRARVEALDAGEHPGRIQLRVLPQFKNVDNTLLPWADPLVGVGMSAEEFSFTPPQVGAMVWCVFTDRYWKNPYWLPGQFLSGFFDYDGQIKPSLDSVTELGNTAYPNVRFRRLPTGTIEFYNADNGEYGTVHNSGSYIIFDVDGNSYTYTVGEAHTYNDNGFVRLTEDGNIELNGAVDFAVRFNELLTAFNQLRTDLNNFIVTYNTHTHADPSSGSTGPPSSPGTNSSADVSSAKVENVLLP